MQFLSFLLFLVMFILDVIRISEYAENSNESHITFHANKLQGLLLLLLKLYVKLLLRR